MLHSIDQYGVQLAASLARNSVIFDGLVTGILTTPTFKLMPLVLCVWMLWFSDQDRESRRLCAVTAVVAGAMALLLGRIIQNLAPERARPIHSNNPDYIMPYGMDAATARDWSSFPSDNAALSIALAVGIFTASRAMGFFCIAWSLIIVCIPRIYGGLHYVSDILGGLVLGLGCYAACAFVPKLPRKLLEWAELLESRNRPAFYALMFFASFQLVTMLGDIRALGRLIFGSA